VLDGSKCGFNTFNIRFHVGITDSGSGTKSGGASELTTFFSPNLAQVVVGVDLTATNATGMSPMFATGKFATLDIPSLTISQSYSNGTFGDIVSLVEFKDCRPITLPSGRFRLTIGTIEWKVNGTIEYTSSAGWTIDSPMAPCPSSFPLWGAGNVITGNSRYNLAPVVGCIGFSETPLEDSVSGQTTGGWEVEIDGTWVQAPISLFPHTESSNTGTISAGDCNSVVINHFVNVSAGGFHSHAKNGLGTVYALPNWDHTCQKMFADYEELVFRWGFPKVQRFDLDVYGSFDCEGTPTGGSGGTTYTDVYGLDTQFLATVTDTAHVIESQLTRTKYAPCNVSGFENFNTVSSYSIENWGSGTSVVLDDSTMSNNLKNSDSHFGWLAEYNNTVTHPDSSYGPWFPPDSASSADRWQVNGSDEAIDYWTNTVRQQWVKNPSLPMGENDHRRTNIIAEAITQNGWNGATNSMIGTPCYWGSDLLAVSDSSVYPASMSPDSSSGSRYSFFNGGGAGTGAVGTDVVMTVGDKVKFAMANWTVKPCMYPMVSDQVNVTWSTTNVTNIKVYAVGIDGTTKVLITDNAQGTFRIPSGMSTVWTTSAIEDFGSIYLTDQYSPVAASDDSVAMVADPARLSSSELLPAFTCQYLEFDVTSTGTVTIHHPIFYLAPLVDAKVFYETGSLSAILFKDGPAVRPGSIIFFNWVTDTVLSTPLAVNPTNGTTTIGDGWSLENCYFKGVDATTGNLTRLGVEFISGEEFPPGITKQLWRYSDGMGGLFPDSISFWANSDVGVKLIYYSTWRASTPTLYFLPTKKRTSASGWSNSGGYGMWRYSFGTSKHPHIVPDNIQPQLKNGGADTLSLATAPHGWRVGTFQGAVTNSEGYTWELWWNGVHWFDMRPWRGQTSIFGLTEATNVLHLCFSPPKLNHLLMYDLADLRFRTFDLNGIDVVNTIVSRPDIDIGQVVWNADGKLPVYYHTTSPNATWFTESHDWGNAWSTPVNIISGRIVAVGSDSTNGTDYVAVWSGTTVDCWTRRTDQTIWTNISTIYSTTTAGLFGWMETGFDQDHRIFLVVADGGNIKFFESNDGGGSWTTAVTITTGKYAALALDRESRSLYLAVLTGGTGTWTYWYSLDPDAPSWVSVGTITTGAKVDWPACLEVTSDSFHRLLFMYTDPSGNVQRLTSINRDGAWGAE
jgi:hypothetical protein